MLPLLTLSWPLFIIILASKKENKKNKSRSTKSDLFLNGTLVSKRSQDYKESFLSGVFLLSVPLHCWGECGKDIETITDQKPDVLHISRTFWASRLAVEQCHDAKWPFFWITPPPSAPLTIAVPTERKCGGSSALTTDPRTCFSRCPHWDVPHWRLASGQYHYHRAAAEGTAPTAAVESSNAMEHNCVIGHGCVTTLMMITVVARKCAAVVVSFKSKYAH